MPKGILTEFCPDFPEQVKGTAMKRLMEKMR